MTDRAAEIIASGDAEAILKMALGALFAAGEGRFCECVEPSLYGYDLMCGNCLLENQGQIDKLTARIRDPHPFEPGKGDSYLRGLWCAVCTQPEDDPRHRMASTGEKT